MQKIIRNFPLKTIQSGAVLGNGWTGILLWGENNQLNITIGCANLWDHRGGMEWTPAQNYRNVRAALETGDENRIKTIFAPVSDGPVKCPSLIPVGRLVLTLPGNASLTRFELYLQSGLTRIFYTIGQEEKFLDFYADMTMHDVLSCSGLDSGCSLKLIPSWELYSGKNTLSELGFEPPQYRTLKHGAGFIQPMPADPSFSVFYRHDSGFLTVGFQRGIADLERSAEQLSDFETIRVSSLKWWQDYWRDVPSISYGDSEIEEIYLHGLYKYGIMTNPDGVTPGLQGPWIEDNRLPPWQGDYHFNINVQMCNMPGFKAGKFSNLKLLFDQVLSWKEKLRHNARCFAGIENGYMLPHAVDDRSVCMGNFWTGTIDHACSAWIAIMMFDYCDYSGDMEFLRSEVYDFMTGVMHVYEAMMEREPDGTLSLPVSVSPEYRGSEIDAWGRNASFQLAAVHRLTRNLLHAAQILGCEPEPSWLEIEQKLPEVTLHENEIALWDGLVLEQSHRHHSHLAGICPFDTIDPFSGKWQKTVDASLYRWIHLGMGEWAGWSMPWASQLHTRIGNGDMATLILKIWKHCFTNASGGSLHDAWFKGFTVLACIRGEIMQVDGCMGAVTAVQDLFLHSQNSILRVFFGIPCSAGLISFERMFAPGGLRISGKIETDGTIRLIAEACRTTRLRIQTRTSQVFEKTMKAGEILYLRQQGDLLNPVETF